MEEPIDAVNSIGAFDKIQTTAARVAGITFLLGTAIVIVANYAITFRLVVPGNAIDTARNLVAHETLFRINIAANLIYVMNVVVQISALYVILKPVNRNLALVAALSRLVFAFMWGLSALDSLGALRLLGDTAYLPVFQLGQLQTLARLHLAANFDEYYVGLPFWALASAVCSYLWFTSRYIPRALAAFGLVASAWGLLCAFAFIVVPQLDAVVNAYWFDVPMTLFELVLGFWLLFTSGAIGRPGDRASC